MMPRTGRGGSHLTGVSAEEGEGVGVGQLVLPLIEQIRSGEMGDGGEGEVVLQRVRRILAPGRFGTVEIVDIRFLCV